MWCPNITKNINCKKIIPVTTIFWGLSVPLKGIPKKICEHKIELMVFNPLNKKNAKQIQVMH